MERRITIILHCLLLSPPGQLAAERVAPRETLPPLKLAEPTNIQLNHDPGFEEPDKPAWRFSDWPPREKTIDRLIARSVFYTSDKVRHGKSAICFEVGTTGPDRHLAATQGLSVSTLKPHDGKTVRMSAWVFLASGPDVYNVHLGIRQWGERGKPPISATSIRMQAMKAEWRYYERTFTLRVGETQRGDLKVAFRTPPAGQETPVCYVDDCRLEALSGAALNVTALSGTSLANPDRQLPVRVQLDAEEWKRGLRHLRWDITSTNGLTSFGHGMVSLTAAQFIVEPALPPLPYGRYGLRISVGHRKNERTHELLKEFRYASGPFSDE